MALRPFFTRQAGRDVRELYQFVHARSPQGAESLFTAIHQSIGILADAPGMGELCAVVDEKLKGLRRTPVRPYRSYIIYFRVHRDRLVIVRVVHGARDSPQVLAETDPESDEEET